MAKLTFNVPDEKTPGYLRRVIAATRFSEMLKEGTLNSTAYEDLITFLMGFITEPKDRGAAREALLDATLEQYNDLLKQVNGQANPTSPEQTETS
jgi:hypothetical protein